MKKLETKLHSNFTTAGSSNLQFAIKLSLFGYFYMKSLIVLSHLSSVGNDLDSETTDRAKLAVELFKCEKYDNLITSGWANNSQFNVPISILLKSYIVDNFDIARSSIVSLPYSRDTVGDAFFCRLLVQNIDLTSMSVITSDYHVQRTSLIFKKFFKKIFVM